MTLVVSRKASLLLFIISLYSLRAAFLRLPHSVVPACQEHFKLAADKDAQTGMHSDRSDTTQCTPGPWVHHGGPLTSLQARAVPACAAKLRLSKACLHPS